MKNIQKIFFLFVLLISIGFSSMAKQPEISFFRYPDQRGLHVFETSTQSDFPYDGLKIRIGGNFTQQFQALSHSNEANTNMAALNNAEVNLNALYPLSAGFNLASANLNIDVQLDDGIRMALESYMSSRHHPEFWVKGGYIQVDKMPMFGNPDWFTRHVSVKIGHMEVNYGDQHFRRSDNGRTIYNPFVGNYIMDAFATEIGGEVYVQINEDFMLMGGLTGGLISGDIKDYGEIKKNPSILAKAAYDKQFSDDLRFRLSASVYTNPGTTRNTLYAGDRAGSRYYLVAEPEYYRNFRAGGAVTATNATDRFTSGRLSPEFTSEVTSFMINPFVKFKGLELFGTYELSSGKNNPDSDTREFSQLAAEVVYRFFKDEQFFIGARYNQVSGELPGANADISVDRLQFGLGWFTTRNLLVKLEYVTQQFNDFDVNDYRHNAIFNGFVIEAAVGF